ncbi:hypothetical protein C8R45DRAFT_1075979 [Mycena sanguinolenta]|nr:hypothetical protein C8R45DRAFT_1075979 [Mycena sanguinolenta]
MSLTLSFGDGGFLCFGSRPYVAGFGVHHYQAQLKGEITPRVHIIRAEIVAPNVGTDTKPKEYILKTARSSEVDALELEASFYSNELQSLQGQCIPRFYGIYHSEGSPEGFPVACMVLEYCGRRNQLLPDEKNRQIMLAACALHAAGITHGNLKKGHHFVESGPSIKIVDFSYATPHSCRGATPCLHPGMGGPRGCPELEMLEKKYGLLTSEPFPTTKISVANKSADGNPLKVLGRRLGMM